MSCSRGQRFRRGRRLDFATPKKRQGRRALSAISKTILMLIALNTPALGPAQASRCWGFVPIYLLGWMRRKIPIDRQAGSSMRDKFSQSIESSAFGFARFQRRDLLSTSAWGKTHPMIQNITPIKWKPASVGSKINLTAMAALGLEPKIWMIITRASK